MMLNYNVSKNYIGTFYVDDEEFQGELVYNRDSGKIALNLKRELYINMAEASDPESHTCKELRKEYHRIDAITGKLGEGNAVVLFNCRCTYSVIKGDQTGDSRVLQFQAEYMIWNDPDAIGRKYSKLVFVLENALRWSQLTQIDCTQGDIVKYDPIKSCPCFNWFGAKIIFGTDLKYDTTNPFQERTQIVERLAVAVLVEEDKDIQYFLDVRNKIMALISYGIKDNLNVVRQYLSQKDDVVKYPEGTFDKNDVEYWKYDLLTNEPYHIVDEKYECDYNFTRPMLSKDSSLPEKLELMTPVFNLYLSLFKYRDMPIEMVFLNMIQALETFHARLFYGDQHGVRFQREVLEKYGETPITEFIFGCIPESKQKKVNLAPRIRHLLVEADEHLFEKFCEDGGTIVNKIVDTRNYYTHYGEGRESRAVKGKDLELLTEFIAFVLEYHVNAQICRELDKTPVIIDELTFTDECEYARYMRKQAEKLDYFASVLPID